MSEIHLSLKPKQNSNENGTPRPENNPVLGWFAVAFGFLGIFTYGVIFVPLGLICSILALFFRQAMWGFIGLLLAFMGLITSPALLLLIGLTALSHWFDSSDLIQPFMDMLGVEPSPGEDV